MRATDTRNLNLDTGKNIQGLETAKLQKARQPQLLITLMKNTSAQKLPIAERRQIENEMIFRRGNEVVGDDLDALDALYIADDNPELIKEDGIVLHFKCECSDENCDDRIPIKLSIYRKIHADRDLFIVKIKHQVDPIEKVIHTEAGYNVVRKNNSTAEPSDILNITPINN